MSVNLKKKLFNLFPSFFLVVVLVGEGSVFNWSYPVCHSDEDDIIFSASIGEGSNSLRKTFLTSLVGNLWATGGFNNTSQNCLFKFI